MNSGLFDVFINAIVSVELGICESLAIYLETAAKETSENVSCKFKSQKGNQRTKVQLQKLFRK